MNGYKLPEFGIKTSANTCVTRIENIARYRQLDLTRIKEPRGKSPIQLYGAVGLGLGDETNQAERSARQKTTAQY
ncbi:MAG: hypothetical protein K8L91_22755 [Anaerolineae bacterium]|nr:hypothetical protein [Anaerolineae bacterium]